MKGPTICVESLSGSAAENRQPLCVPFRIDPGVTLVLAGNSYGKSFAARIIHEIFAYTGNLQSNVLVEEHRVEVEKGKEVTVARVRVHNPGEILDLFKRYMLFNFDQDNQYSGLGIFVSEDAMRYVARNKPALTMFPETPSTFLDRMIDGALKTFDILGFDKEASARIKKLLERKKRILDAFATEPGKRRIKPRDADEVAAQRLLEELKEEADELSNRLDELRSELAAISEIDINTISRELERRKMKLNELRNEKRRIEEELNSVASKLGISVDYNNLGAFADTVSVYRSSIEKKRREIEEEITTVESIMARVKNASDTVSSMVGNVVIDDKEKRVKIPQLETTIAVIKSKINEISNIKLYGGDAETISDVKKSIDDAASMCTKYGDACRGLDSLASLLTVVADMLGRAEINTRDLDNAVIRLRSAVDDLEKAAERLGRELYTKIYRDVIAIKKEAQIVLSSIETVLNSLRNEKEKLESNKIDVDVSSLVDRYSTLTTEISRVEEEVKRLEEEYRKALASASDDRRKRIVNEIESIERRLKEIESQIAKIEAMRSPKDEEAITDEDLGSIKSYVDGCKAIFERFYETLLTRYIESNRERVLSPRIMSTSTYISYLVSVSVAFNYLLNRFLSDYIRIRWGFDGSIPLIIDIPAAYDTEHLKTLVELLYRYAVENNVRVYIFYVSDRPLVINIGSKEELDEALNTLQTI
ncbi:MAG: hypothetical protein QXE01_05010 [Sulfolobales archaeon]